MSNNTGISRAMFNAFSSHVVRGVDQVPNNVKTNYKNKIARGNYRAAFNVISKYLPYYKRNNLANLVGQFNSHPVQPHARLANNKTNYKKNNNAKAVLNRARAGNAKSILNIIQPYRGGSGGVQLGYYNERVNKNPIKYAMTNRNSGKLYAFALLENNKPEPGTRYLDILGGLKGSGGRLMKKIIANAKTNGRNSITLKAVVRRSSMVGHRRLPVNENGTRNELVSWYEGFGFNTNGKSVNVQGLQPMILYLRNRNIIQDKRKRELKRKMNERAAMITPRVTRARA
jgi:hypothetical protein